MSRVRLTILQPNLAEQRYSCHGCGNCCRDFTVQVRDDDLDRLREQGWPEKLGIDPVIEFRGTRFLRQQPDGSCIFLMDDGRCRIHAEYGFEAKPVACRFFPFHLTPGESGAVMGLNFACQSVLENKGAELRSHVKDLQRMAKEVPEIDAAVHPPMLTNDLRASWREVRAIESRIDAWLRRTDVSLPLRIDGLCFIAQSLARAKFEKVRDKRFAELLDTLFGALPGELEHVPVGPPTAGQRRMLRQAVFARTEDPKLDAVLKRGKALTAIGQFMRSRRFASGKGEAPAIGADWPGGVHLADVEFVEPATDNTTIEQIDDLITRWLRAATLGSRAWGFGYYLWPITYGLQALMLNVACVGWLARLHALGRDDGPKSIELDDVRAALSRIDRTAGRAKWLGTRTEMLRLKYFNADDGLRRLTQRYAMVEDA